MVEPAPPYPVALVRRGVQVSEKLVLVESNEPVETSVWPEPFVKLYAAGSGPRRGDCRRPGIG